MEIVEDQPHRSWPHSQLVHQRGDHVFDAVGILDENVERVGGRAGLQDGEAEAMEVQSRTRRNPTGRTRSRRSGLGPLGDPRGEQYGSCRPQGFLRRACRDAERPHRACSGGPAV